MSNPIDRLLRRLDLETVGPTHHIGRAGSRSVSVGTRIFGGMLLGQLVVAASRAVPDLTLHTLQVCFVRPGQANGEIHYHVEPTMVTANSGTAALTGRQGDDVVVQALARLATGSDGPLHAPPMPDVIDPEGAVDRDQVRGRQDWQDQPIEFRIPPDDNPDSPTMFWLRARGPIPDDQAIERAVLAYASDRGLLRASVQQHQHWGRLQGASLDHTIWFHQPPRLGDWSLSVVDGPAAAGGRGLAQGRVYDAAGSHIASTAQEGLLRFD